MNVNVDRSATTMIMTVTMPMIMPIDTDSNYCYRPPPTGVVSIIIWWYIGYVHR